MPEPVQPTPTFVPMPGGQRPAAALDALLKRPGQLIYQLHHAPRGRIVATLAAVTLVCLVLYGLTVGSFSGREQWWAAPTKIVLGTAASALICLPSLYIFGCLGGADLRLAPLCGTLVAVLCLNSLLLIGFAPVAWVFSQSTDALALIGGLHLAFWAVGAVFALRLLWTMLDFIQPGAYKGYLKVWFAVFGLVCLQMTTALRPIVGRSDTFLPTKKLFFLSHWGKNLSGEAEE
ncbi:MAG: hypothetical protein INR65_20430 [Gluconacetobacter diazotrophicus]|nr:hypothetical protein [Gluconacetobacter diazotrophicus]